MKAHFPLEFTAANLKFSKGVDSSIKILRDAVENEGIEYVAIDPDLSEVDWSVKEGKLIGGLVNIKGIAEAKAKEIIRMRNGEKKFTPSLTKVLLEPVTDFDTLYPCQDKFGAFYNNPRAVGLNAPISYIKDIKIDEQNEVIVLGKLKRKDVLDLNEYNEVQKRNGKVYINNTLVFKISIEDDSEKINCRINRFKFEEKNGWHWNNELVVDESYVLIKGTVLKDIRMIYIEEIFDLTNFVVDGE